MGKKKIGFALGGGGGRGLAHVGVVKVLLSEGIQPDLIVGTSIGAIAGALFASSLDIDSVVEKVHDYFTCDCFDRIKLDFLAEQDESTNSEGLFDALSRFLRKKIFFNVALARQQSYVPLDVYMENISFLIDDIDIKDTRIPLAIVCTDVNNGEEVILTEGPLRLAVAASSAIPGVFPPIDFQGRTLLDGGWVNQLPTSACSKLGADFVIGVDVAGELEQEFSTDTGLDILQRTNAITRATLTKLKSKDADVIIIPDMGNVSWATFECVGGCFLQGEEAARKALPEIRKKYAEKSSLVRRFFGAL